MMLSMTTTPEVRQRVDGIRQRYNVGPRQRNRGAQSALVDRLAAAASVNASDSTVTLSMPIEEYEELTEQIRAEDPWAVDEGDLDLPDPSAKRDWFSSASDLPEDGRVTVAVGIDTGEIADIRRAGRLISYYLQASARPPKEDQKWDVDVTNGRLMVSFDSSRSPRTNKAKELANTSLLDTLRNGTPVRKSDRSGPGTKGTRAEEGLGHEEFSVGFGWTEAPVWADCEGLIAPYVTTQGSEAPRQVLVPRRILNELVERDFVALGEVLNQGPTVRRALEATADIGDPESWEFSIDVRRPPGHEPRLAIDGLIYNGERTDDVIDGINDWLPSASTPPGPKSDKIVLWWGS